MSDKCKKLKSCALIGCVCYQFKDTINDSQLDPSETTASLADLYRMLDAEKAKNKWYLDALADEAVRIEKKDARIAELEKVMDDMAKVIKNYCVGRGSSDTEYARQALSAYNETKGKR